MKWPRAFSTIGKCSANPLVVGILSCRNQTDKIAIIVQHARNKSTCPTIRSSIAVKRESQHPRTTLENVVSHSPCLVVVEKIP